MKIKNYIIACLLLAVSVFCSNVDCFADTVISATITVNGIDEPNIGCMFPGNGTDNNPDIKLSNSNQYYISDIVWYQGSTSADKYDRVKAGQKHTIVITLNANSGYYFDSRTEKAYLSLNGSTKSMKLTTVNKYTVKVSYDFGTTSNEFVEYGTYRVEGYVGYITDKNLNDILGPYDGDKATIKYSLSGYEADGKTYDMITLDSCGSETEHIYLSVGNEWYDYSDGDLTKRSGSSSNIAIHTIGRSVLRGIGTYPLVDNTILFVKDSKTLYFNDNSTLSAFYCVTGFKDVIIEDGVSLMYNEDYDGTHLEDHAFIDVEGTVTIGNDCELGVTKTPAYLYHFISAKKIVIGKYDKIEAYGKYGALNCNTLIMNKNFYNATVIKDKSGEKVEWDKTTALNNSYYVYAKLSLSDITITESPEDASGKNGDLAYFNVKASGAIESYLWQYSLDGGISWRVYSESVGQTASITVEISEETANRLYRCLVYNNYSVKISETAKVILTGWAQNGDNWYYYDGNGNIVTGWYQVGGRWFLFDDAGKMLTGWQKVGGRWFLLHSDGYMVTGWIQYNGKWCYLDPISGAMATGWKQVNNKWYYFDASGYMQVGWKSINGKWYYFNKDGDMKTGWLYDGGSYYYLNPDGDMRIGWLQEGSTWYYLKSDGRMACNETLKIGNVYYTFNSSGAWVK